MSIKKDTEELIIQQKVYDMILYAYPAIEQFPKSQKFSLAQDMKKNMNQIMRLVITANKKYTKKTTLQELDIEVTALKTYIRIACDLNYLSIKKYEVWSKMLVEIGRMVGGWIKSTRESPIPKREAESERMLNCSDCDAEITAKIKNFSENKFGKALCYKCQKKQGE